MAVSDLAKLGVADDSAPGQKKSWLARQLDHPLRSTLILSILCILLLQLWRPFYHLTDDNLTAYLPVFVEFSHRLWSGQNPMINDSLFEGGYSYMRDPSVFGLLSPFMFLCTPLGLTSWAHWVPDIVASLNLLVIAGAFCWSAVQLRKHLNLEVSNGVIIALSVSYAFSGFNLVVNPSWIGFINPQATAPLLLAGLFEPNWRRAAMIIAGGMLFALFGGHVHPFIYMCLIAAVMAGVVAWHQRSWSPIQRLAAGAILTALVAAPILIPALFGFASSVRQGAMSQGMVMLSRLRPAELLISIFFGPVGAPIVPDMQVHSSEHTFSSSIAFSLVNIPLLFVLIGKRRWSRLEFGLIGMLLMIGLFITRPVVLQHVLDQLPLLRSLRWPFREVANLNFVLHTMALLNLTAFSHPRVRMGFVIGAAMFGVAVFGAPPTFNPMHIDRELVIEGRPQAFWAQMKTHLGERPHIIVSGPLFFTYGKAMQFVPFSFLGAYNYASMLGIVNHSGYSTTQTGTLGMTEPAPYHLGGIYHPGDAEEICRAHPELTHVSLLQIKPAGFLIRQRGHDYRFTYDPQTGKLTQVFEKFEREKLAEQQRAAAAAAANAPAPAATPEPAKPNP